MGGRDGVSDNLKRECQEQGIDTLILSYCVKTLWGHEQWVRSVSPSEDGKLLVTASSDLVGISHRRAVKCS
jgi:WD40 repeat protein